MSPAASRKGLMAPQNNFLEKISKRFKGQHSNFVLGNAAAPPDYPIVYCSDGFCSLTGMHRAEIMQQPSVCPWLWSESQENSDTHQMNNILEAFDNQIELKLSVQFFKKSGVPFWCLLDIIPIQNEVGKVVLFLLSYKDISNTYTPSRNASVYSLESDKKINKSAFAGDEAEADISSRFEDNFNYSRRRSRAILNELSGKYFQNKRPGRQKLLERMYSTCESSQLPIYKPNQLESSQRCIIAHYGTFRKCWDCIILTAILYVATIVPFNAAFFKDSVGNCHQQKIETSLVFDGLIEAIFILDIFFNFHITYVNAKGEVVFDRKSIALKYLKGWFLLDLLAALPFDLLYATCMFESLENFDSVELLKLTRLVRLARFLQKMERFYQYSAVILSLLMTCFILISHWLACIWIVIGRYQDGGEDVGWMEQLADLYRLENKTLISHLDAYTTALYFTSSSLTTIGFGNVSGNTREEKIFSILIMFIGALMHATIFGNVATIISRMYSKRQEYEMKVLDLEHFVSVHKLPKHLKQRMEDHLQTKWFFNRGLDAKIHLEYPQHLQGEINYYLNKEVLDLPVFEDLNENFIKALGSGILPQFAGPNDCLVYRDDPVSMIWYIKSGSMEVMDGDMVVAILGAGDLVGCDLEDHLENPNRNVITRSGFLVKALTYCEMKAIKLEHLLELYRQYPEMMDTELSARIMNDLTFNLKSSSIIMDSSGSGRLLLSDKETQTELSDSDTDSNNLIINDTVDPDTVSQTSVVKFNFEACPSIASPLRSPLRSPSTSNSQINKTILKKQKEILSTQSLQRSTSLSDPSKELSPLLNKSFIGNGRPKSQETNRLARFRERFASNKSSSLDCASDCNTGSRNLALDIPEIILNSPEEENSLLV